MRVLTIGHEGRTPVQLLDLLAIHGVTHVVDVRQPEAWAGAPEFDPSRVRADLLARGMFYANMSESLTMHAGGDQDEDLHSGLQQLMQVVMSDPERLVCLLGYSNDPKVCPRCTAIGVSLSRARILVEHIVDEGLVPQPS